MQLFFVNERGPHVTRAIESSAVHCVVHFKHVEDPPFLKIMK